MYSMREAFDLVKVTELYQSLLETAQKDFVESKVNATECDSKLKERIHSWLVEKNSYLPIKNEVCKLLLNKCKKLPLEKQAVMRYDWNISLPLLSDIQISKDSHESLEIVSNARNQWDTRLRYQLRTLSGQQKRALIQIHSPTGTEDASSDEVLSLRYIYTCEDLLETLANIVNPNASRNMSLCWGLMKINLKTNNLQELRIKYKELNPKNKHLGCDNIVNINSKKSSSETCNNNNNHNNANNCSKSSNTNNTNNNTIDSFIVYKLKEGERLIETPYIPQLREYAKFGVPNGIRSKIWKLLLGLEIENTQQEEKYFDVLLDATDDWDIITDALYRLDVDQTVDHEDFFPFDEFLSDLMLAFSRDCQVPKLVLQRAQIILNTVPLPRDPSCSANDTSTNPTKSPTNDIANSDESVQVSETKESDLIDKPGNDTVANRENENGSENKNVTSNESENARAQNAVDGKKSNESLLNSLMDPTIVPPNQVIPFHQLTLLAAPLCYMFEEPKDCYFLFRAMFVKYWCQLHVISSKDNTILYLCKSFETLAQYCYPNAYFHAVQVGCHPLTIVFPWIFTGFAGYLTIEEILLIWDRVLAYDDLEIMAILSAAIFGFRANDILVAENEDDIHALFHDIRSLKVIPLLQHFLFAKR